MEYTGITSNYKEHYLVNSQRKTNLYIISTDSYRSIPRKAIPGAIIIDLSGKKEKEQQYIINNCKIITIIDVAHTVEEAKNLIKNYSPQIVLFYKNIISERKNEKEIENYLSINCGNITSGAFNLIE